MTGVPLDKSLSSHLGVIIRPDLLATVCCLDKVFSNSPPFSHLPGEFLVHQTCCEHLEGPPLVLCMVVNDGKPGPELHAHLVL